jgi:hypothetical protein
VASTTLLSFIACLPDLFSTITEVILLFSVCAETA